MKTFNEWLSERLPLILKGLKAEAIKAGSFEEFEKDFHMQNKKGLYWHWTDDPNFQIDKEKGPRDLSSMAVGGYTDKGKLMITSNLSDWSSHGGGRPYAAIIDMSNVPRNSYYQVKRGFGNEFMVSDPSLAKVIKVVSRPQAFRIDRDQSKYLPGSEEELFNFYNASIPQK